MVRIGTIVIGAADVDRAVEFWSAALGFDVIGFPGSENGFTILRPPSGRGARLAVQRDDRPADPVPRVHLDLVVDSAADQRREIDRLVALGASAVEWASYPPDHDFVVLADPAGNRFCVVDASHGEQT